MGKVLGKLPKQIESEPRNLQQLKASISESPYINSELLNEDIEPEADITEDSLEPLFDEKTRNSRTLIIKSLRAHLTQKLKDLEEIKRGCNCTAVVELAHAEKYLTEAKFWLGWELNRIYKERQQYKRDQQEKECIDKYSNMGKAESGRAINKTYDPVKEFRPGTQRD